MYFVFVYRFYNWLSRVHFFFIIDYLVNKIIFPCICLRWITSIFFWDGAEKNHIDIFLRWCREAADFIMSDPHHHTPLHHVESTLFYTMSNPHNHTPLHHVESTLFYITSISLHFYQCRLNWLLSNFITPLSMQTKLTPF